MKAFPVINPVHRTFRQSRPSRDLLLCSCILCVLISWSPCSVFYKEHLKKYMAARLSLKPGDPRKDRRWWGRSQMLTSSELCPFTQCGDGQYVLFSFVLNHHLTRQWAIAKVFTPRNITYQIKLLCLPKKHVFNFTGNSKESKLGSRFTNREHHMTGDHGFCLCFRGLISFFTGKAHSSHVLKKQISFK